MSESFKCAHTDVIELHKLQPNPKNPNNHPERQIELLSKIIDFQGQRAPIVVSKRSGFVVKGHGRLEAMKKLGWQSAAVDSQDYKNEAEEWADLVADNKIQELSSLNTEEVKRITLEDFPDMDLTGELLGFDCLDLSAESLSLDDLNEDDKLYGHFAEKGGPKEGTRAINIVFAVEDYEDFIRRSKPIMQAKNIESMKDYILFLQQNYEDNNS